MSTMQKFDDIRQEIDSINITQAEAKSKTGFLRDFILPKRDEATGKEVPSTLLEDPNRFNRLLSEWAESLTSLVEATGRNFSFGQPSPFGVATGKSINEGGLTKTEQSDMTLIKGVVLVAAILGTVLISVMMKAPWTIALIVIIAVICLVFVRQIGDYIRELMKKPEDLIAAEDGLSDEIAESLSFIRKRYVQILFRIKLQSSDPHRQHNPNEDKALYDLKTQALQRLPFEFMNRIDTIVVKCNGVAFERKKVLFAYWNASSPQPQFQTPQSPMQVPNQ